MHKDVYMEHPIVKEFVDWFITDGLIQHSHSYRSKRLRKDQSSLVTFTNLPQAFELYFWPFNKIQDCRGKDYLCTTGSFKESCYILDILSEDLRASLEAGDHQKFQASAIALMKWGGTHRTRVNGGIRVGNIPWFERPESLNEVQKGVSLFSLNDDKLSLFGEDFRFNSGFTKLYSLLLPDFIIYDSRVAAALAWFTYHFMEATGYSKIPDQLKFACMRDNSHCRNPGTLFPYINKPSMHAHWNIRANWILSSVVNKMPPNSISQSLNPLRSLEAGLFMWGYEV